MTLNYYVNELRQLVRDNGDDSALDDRLLERWINSQRVLWIKNQVNNESSIEDNVKQTLPCLELRVTDASECSYLSRGRSYLVTKRELPKPIEFKDRLGFVDVRVPEIGGYPINMVKKENIGTTGNGRYNSRDIFGFYHNSHIYIKVPKNNYRAALLTNISVDGVFENPLALAGYNNCNGSKCFDKDTDDYPINDALWEYMLGAILKKLGMFEQEVPKLANDESEVT